MITKLISVLTVFASLTIATMTQAMDCQNATGSISIWESSPVGGVMPIYSYELVISQNGNVFGEIRTPEISYPSSAVAVEKNELVMTPVSNEISLNHQVDSISDKLTFAVEFKITHLVTAEVLQDWFICESRSFLIPLP